MNKIGDSLKRKIGPLPAWAWILMLGVGIWYYRNKLSKGAMVSGTGTGSVGPASNAGPPVVVGPGEGVYDPGTGILSTNPGGGGGGGNSNNTSTGGDGTGLGGGGGGMGGGGGGTDTGGTAAGGTTGDGGGTGAASTAGNVNSGGTTGAGSGTAGAAHPAVHLVKPAAIGAFVRNPVTKRITGRVGGGGFRYASTIGGKRGSKPKNQHGPPKKTTAPKKGVLRTRSTSSVRHTTGGRTSGHSGGVALQRTATVRGGVKASASQARQQSTKRTQPLVTKPTVRQRPVANATPNRAPAVPSSHRTASTPARSVSRTRTTSAPAPRPVSHPAPPPPPPPPPRRPPPPPPRRGRR